MDEQQQRIMEVQYGVKLCQCAKESKDPSDIGLILAVTMGAKATVETKWKLQQCLLQGAGMQDTRISSRPEIPVKSNFIHEVDCLPLWYYKKEKHVGEKL